MPSEITPDDEGKTVVSGDEKLGRIVDVEDDTAYVDPDPDITDTVMSKLGWSDETAREGAYPLSEESVEEITADEVRVSEDM